MAMIPEGEMNGDGSSVEPSMAGRFTKFFLPRIHQEYQWVCGLNPPQH